MASITGSIPLTNFIAPNSSADSYPITKPIYGLGGLRTVGNTGERDAITSARREAGMVVYVADIQKYYTFKGPTGNGDWTELVLGSSGGATGATGATGARGTTGTNGAGYLSGSGQEIDMSELVIGNSYPISVSTTPAPAYSFGQTLLIVDDFNVTNYFIGTVTNWASATNIVTLTIAEINGSVTSTSWTLNLVGPRGSNGSIGATGVTGLAGDIYKSIGTAGITLASIGSGVTLTVPSGLAYSKVQTVLVAAGACQYFIGTVNTYSGVTLSLTVNSVTGTAFSNVWDVNLNGAVGQKGDPGIQGPTGADGISGPYVISVNGATGIVQNVAKTNTTNSFDLTQTFSSGFISNQDILVQGMVIGRGGSGGGTNITIGSSNNTSQTTTSFGNLSIGNGALSFNETGGYNVAIGLSALEDIEAPFYNTALGHNSLRNILNTSDSNVAIGFNAGANRGITNAAPLTNANNSIFIGNNARPLANASTNELVIGSNALGLGNNSTVIGNTLITNARIYGLLNLPSGISAPNIINSINGFTGTVGFSAGTGITLTTSGNTLIISATAVSGITSGVESLRGLTGVIGLVAGTGITFGISGNTLTIISTVTGSCAGASAGVQTFNGNTGDIVVSMVGSIATTTPLALGVTFTTDAFWPFYKNYTISNTGVRTLNGFTGSVGIDYTDGISINSSGNSIIIANTGVRSLTGSTGISLTGSTGAITITNTGVNDLTASTGLSISGSKTGSLTISNTGVLSINSETGVVTNFAKTNLANIFTFNQAITKKSPTLTLNDSFSFSSSVIEANKISFISPVGATQSWIPGAGSTISFPASSGTIALTSETVSRINGLTGTVGLSAGTGISITPSGNTLTITATAVSGITSAVLSIRGLTGIVGLSAGTGISITPSGNTLTISATAVSGSCTDGSAIIYKLYPNLPVNGLCAGDIISYNGSCAWIPTPREYLVTPSIWQTRRTSTNGYPTSTLRQPGNGTLEIQGATAVVGELIQLSLSGDDAAGTTLGRGTWWLNYSIYKDMNAGSDQGRFNGSFSGLTILNSPVFYTAASLSGDSDHDVAGFAMLIRGSTYNAYDGRGGPYGNTACSASPNTMPLGVGSACEGNGVVGYPIICSPRYGQGFTYGGEFYECVNV